MVVTWSLVRTRDPQTWWLNIFQEMNEGNVFNKRVGGTFALVDSDDVRSVEDRLVIRVTSTNYLRIY